VSVTAYHSFGGEVEASNTPTIRRLTPSSRHQLSSIAHLDQDHPEYAEIEFETQADANTAVTQLNEIFQKAILITFKKP
jgi:hypothetical protein